MKDDGSSVSCLVCEIEDRGTVIECDFETRLLHHFPADTKEHERHES